MQICFCNIEHRAAAAIFEHLAAAAVFYLKKAIASFVCLSLWQSMVYNYQLLGDLQRETLVVTAFCNLTVTHRDSGADIMARKWKAWQVVCIPMQSNLKPCQLPTLACFYIAGTPHYHITSITAPTTCIKNEHNPVSTLKINNKNCTDQIVCFFRIY